MAHPSHNSIRVMYCRINPTFIDEPKRATVRIYLQHGVVQQMVWLPHSPNVNITESLCKFCSCQRDRPVTPGNNLCDCCTVWLRRVSCYKTLRGCVGTIFTTQISLLLSDSRSNRRANRLQTSADRDFNTHRT